MIALAIVLIVFIPISLYFETSLFFQQVSVQPIKVYYVSHFGIVLGSVESGIYASGWIAPNWTINDLDVTFDNVFNDSNMHFELSYNNLSITPVGWHSTGNEGFENLTEVSQYMKDNSPDMLITFPSIQNGTYLCYRDIVDISAPTFGTYAKSVFCKPFLKRTLFDTWEGEILLDSSMTTINLTTINPMDNRTFITVNVQSMSLNLEIPSNYQVQNIESVGITPNPNGVTVTKNLGSGETFHLVVKDLNLEPSKSVMDFVSNLGIISTIIAIFISAYVEHGKDKRKLKRVKRDKKIARTTYTSDE